MASDPWPPKAYKNAAFLNSRAARKIRVLCEMEEPEARFKEEHIEDTIVFFGSARSRSTEHAKAEMEAVLARLGGREPETAEEKEALRRATALAKLAPFHDAATELARRMTLWSKSIHKKGRRFIICTGGGPGMMEAANKGAKDAAGASIGLGISLPFEQGINAYVTPDLAFEFHYFFVRKYWFAYWAKALVVFPGGFGTMDELFELMTLIQTRKISKTMPIVLFGSAFWNSVLNFEAYVEWGVISPQDLDLFKIVDTVEEAEAYLVGTLSAAHLGPPLSPAP